jgi:hypothetical protein
MTRIATLTRRRALAAAGLALALGLGAPPSLAVPVPVPAKRAPADASSTEPLPVFEGVDPELEKVKAQIESLRQLLYAVVVPVGVLVALLAAAGLLVGGAAILALVRHDRRGRRQEAAATRAAAASRAEIPLAPLLETMQRTLALVEETVRLGREASERAERAPTIRAAARLTELDRRARVALAAMAPGLEARTALDDPRVQHDVAELAAELTAVEGWLRVHDVPTSPAGLLVQGLHQHLRQRPAAALARFREAALRATEPELTRIARGWIGRELGALGRFAEAARALAEARDAEPVGAPGRLELDRQHVEARFFAVAEATARGTGGALTTVLEPLDAELARLRAELPDQSPAYSPVRRRLFATSGDVLTWAARHLAAADGRKGSLERAVAYYESAGEGLWPRSGWLEARHALGEVVDAGEYRQLADQAIALLASRLEAGDLATLHLARLIAQDRLGAPPGEVEATYREIRTALRDTDRQVCLLSPRERCALPWEAFEAHAQSVYQEVRERAAAPATVEAPPPPAPPASGPPRYAKLAPRTAAPRGERGASRGGLPG